MVKVRWLTGVGGEFDRQAGDITDETEEFASKWADGERAVRLDRERTPETTAERAPEAAVTRTNRGRGR